MAQALLRYRPRPGAKQRALPTTLERRDLDQESWLILAHLAERWRPSGGSFGGYFRVSFPWALARYVKRHSPNRRSRVVRVLGAERPDVQERLDNSSGADGREWDRDLSWLETLQDLTDRQRAVLSLHLAEGVPFTTLAQALSLTRSTTYRLYQQALKRVQSSPARVGSSTVLSTPGVSIWIARVSWCGWSAPFTTAPGPTVNCPTASGCWPKRACPPGAYGGCSAS
jgi:RNA polymerase sigma factor (sigma-70 family)